MVWEAVRGLSGLHSVRIEPSLTVCLVLCASMGVDWWRSRKLKRIADKYDSQALEADALHFSTDIFSSAIVAVGLALVWAAGRWGVPGLAKADPVAALVASGVIVYASSRLGGPTIDALVAPAPPD